MRAMLAREKRTWQELKKLGFKYFITAQNNVRQPYIYYAFHHNLIGQWDLNQTLEPSDVRNLENEIKRVNENRYGRQLTMHCP